MAATFGSLRQRLFAVTVAITALTTASGEASVEKVQLFFKASSCQYNNSTRENVCDLTNQTKRDAVLAGTDWDDIRTTTVIGAKSLLIQPQGKAESKELHVVSCRDVNTVDAIDADRVRLHLRQSSAGTISSVVNLLRARMSEIRKVDLNPVSQFDFTDCKVHSLAIRAVESKCTISATEIGLIRSVVLEGNFKFEVYNSTIGDIEYLHYNSNYRVSTITEATINNVQEDGMVISKGLLKLENVTIDNLDPMAIRIEDEGELRVERSTITHASVDSLIMNGGSVLFSDVRLGDQNNVSFVISNASGGLQPFAIALKRPSTVSSIVISAVIGFLLGVITCAALYFFFAHRRGSLKSQDREGMELLANNTAKPTAKPSPYSPQPQQKDVDKEVDEFYEEYIDVDVDGAPPPLPNDADPPHSSNHRAPPQNQPAPTPAAQPQAIMSLPPLPENAQLPSPANSSVPPKTPQPQHNQRPLDRVPPPLPQRKESVKGKLSSPSSSSSFSEDRDNADALPKKPQVSSQKPSFLHMVGEGSKASSSPAPKPGAPMDPRGRPVLPSKPLLPPPPQKPSTLSLEEEEDDIYDTLDEN